MLQKRACIARPQEELTEEGKVVDFFIKRIEEIYDNIVIDEYVIMPNHIHLLLIIKKEDKTISKVIQQFKGAVTKKIGYSIWQKLFYDHIIEDREEYFAIKQYIKNNPNTWEDDFC